MGAGDTKRMARFRRECVRGARGYSRQMRSLSSPANKGGKACAARAARSVMRKSTQGIPRHTVTLRHSFVRVGDCIRNGYVWGKCDECAKLQQGEPIAGRVTPFYNFITGDYKENPEIMEQRVAWGHAMRVSKQHETAINRRSGVYSILDNISKEKE